MPEETEQNEESPEESPEEETGETAVDEDEETAEEDQGAGGIGNLLSPEGFVMMSVATTIDLISIIIVFVGLDDFGITDTIGIIIIGSWMFFKSGTMPEKPQRPGKPEVPTKGGGKILKRFALTGVAELVPYLGVIPWWTISVYQTLTE